MRRAKVFLAMIIVDLLSACVLLLAHYSYALDPNAIPSIQGRWGAASGSAGPIDESSTPPLATTGCWSREVDDNARGTGTTEMQFDRNSNPKKLVTESSFHFKWGREAFTFGRVKRTVTSTQFKVKSDAKAGCEVLGGGVGAHTQLIGTAEFKGNCAGVFHDVTFSIAPGC